MKCQKTTSLFPICSDLFNFSKTNTLKADFSSHHVPSTVYVLFPIKISTNSPNYYWAHWIQKSYKIISEHPLFNSERAWLSQAEYLLPLTMRLNCLMSSGFCSELMIYSPSSLSPTSSRIRWLRAWFSLTRRFTTSPSFIINSSWPGGPSLGLKITLAPPAGNKIW